MTSAPLVLYLGCWLAGRSGVWGELRYPKLNISLYPSEEVVLGGTVTVRCECRCPGARVLLSKAGDPAPGLATDSVGDVVEFLIHNLSRGHAGTYSCRYSTKKDPEVWSEPSDPVELVVAGSQGKQRKLRHAYKAFQLRHTRFPPSPIPADARFHPTEGTGPAGPQQPDPPTTEPAGEGYTRGNIVRLALSAGVLLILAEAARAWRRGRP